MSESISSWLWKPLAVILVFVVAGGLTRVIMGSDEPQLSRRHQAVLDGLRDRTNELVVQYADLGHLPGDWYDCTEPEDNDTAYYYWPDSSGNVTDVTTGTNRNIGRAGSAFCGRDSAVWVGSALELARDREALLGINSAYRDLSRGTDEQLGKLVGLVAHDWHLDEPYDESWLNAPIGDTGYSFKFREFRAIEYTYYRFAFNRNVALAVLHMRMPSSMADDDDAIAVARAFDRRIQAAIDSLETADN